MDCKCGNPECKNEINVDTESHTLLATSEGGNVLIYVDAAMAKELIVKLYEIRIDCDA